MSTVVDRLMEQVKALTVEERRTLREKLDALVPAGDLRSKQEALAELLVRDGLVQSVPPAVVDPAPYRNRPLAQVRGEPVSETIIRERR